MKNSLELDVTYLRLFLHGLTTFLENSTDRVLDMYRQRGDAVTAYAIDSAIMSIYLLRDQLDALSLTMESDEQAGKTEGAESHA